MKHRIYSIARVIACASFLVLTIIGVSSVVRAMSLETIANENGIPSSWQVASLGNPETITVPATFWDQRQDDCDDQNRQFEWVICGYWTKGALQGIVKNSLGTDGLPVPTFTNSTDAWNANYDVFSANVTGHDPVQPTDNFYRWFHEVPNLSQRIDGRTVTFTRINNSNTYVYGRDGIFPLDDVSFSDGDEATKSGGHNFHFTSHLRIPVKISTDGTEEFYFSGDDDVWVFLNNQLVLDIGGLHEKLEGRFKINKDGTVTTYVQRVNDPSGRPALGTPSNSYNGYVNPLNEYILRTSKDTTKTIDVGLKEDAVVNLDFFYAERSTSESNTNITITNMNWPISADSELNAEVIGRIGNTNSNLVQFTSSIKNRDPENPLDIERIAAFIKEETKDKTTSGFLPLSSKTLYYSSTPEDKDSWQPVEISAPENSNNGFKLETPLRLSPAGTTGDALYFRYFGDSSDLTGNIYGKISYYTSINGNAGVTYDSDTVSYEAPIDYVVRVKYLYEDDSEAAPTYTEKLPVGGTYEVTSPDIDGYTPDITKVYGTIVDGNVEYVVYYKRIPEVPPVPDDKPKHIVTIKYIYEDGTPAAESYVEELDEGSDYSVVSPGIDTYIPDQTKVEGTIVDQDVEHVVVYRKDPETVSPVDPQPVTPPSIPSTDIIDDDLVYLAPLGEVAFIPNTGIVSDAIAAVFEEAFAEIILSQSFVMAVLLIFAGSFAVYFSLRKFSNIEPAAAVRGVTKSNKAKSYAKTSKRTMPKAAKVAKTTKAVKAIRKSSTKAAKGKKK